MLAHSTGPSSMDRDSGVLLTRRLPNVRGISGTNLGPKAGYAPDMRPAPEAPAASSRVGLLLVDDIPANLIALEAVLDRPDYELVSVTSGAAAIREVETRNFAVILLDVQMPIMDGFETADRIKAIERSRSIPIIFVTAIDHAPSRVTMADKTGAVDFIQKPFDPDIMRAKVAVFVDLYRAQAKTRRDEAALREAHSDLLDREQEVRAEADQLATSLEEAGRLKQEFLTTLGRELRSPLNTILSWTRMLRDGSLPRCGTQIRPSTFRSSVAAIAVVPSTRSSTVPRAHAASSPA